MLALQVDDANMWENIDYPNLVHFNDLIIIATEKDAHEGAALADTDVETDEEIETTEEEFTTTQKEHHIFRNLYDIGGIVVQPVIQTSYVESFTTTTIGIDTAPTDVGVPRTDAKLQVF